MNEVISARTRERDVANTDSELIAGTCNPALSTDRPIAILLIVPTSVSEVGNPVEATTCGTPS